MLEDTQSRDRALFKKGIYIELESEIHKILGIITSAFWLCLFSEDENEINCLPRSKVLDISQTKTLTEGVML